MAARSGPAATGGRGTRQRGRPEAGPPRHSPGPRSSAARGACSPPSSCFCLDRCLELLLLQFRLPLRLRPRLHLPSPAGPGSWRSRCRDGRPASCPRTRTSGPCSFLPSVITFACPGAAQLSVTLSAIARCSSPTRCGPAGRHDGGPRSTAGPPDDMMAGLLGRGAARPHCLRTAGLPDGMMAARVAPQVRRTT